MTRITLLIILLLKEIADNGRKQIMLQIKGKGNNAYLTHALIGVDVTKKQT